MRVLLPWLVLPLLAGCASTTGGGNPRATTVALRTLVGVTLTMNGDAPPDSDTGEDAWFSYNGFPALSADGRVVANVTEENDGARGFDNLHLYTFDVDTGKVVDHIVILSTDDYERIETSESAAERQAALVATRAAFIRANERLAATQWAPLVPLEGRHFEMETPSTPWATADGALLVHYDEPTVRVDSLAAKDSFSRNYPDAVAPTYDLCAEVAVDENNEPVALHPDPDDTCPCENPGSTAAIWTDANRTLFAVEVAYYGTDLCWEPTNAWVIGRVPTAADAGWSRAPRTPEGLALSATWTLLEVPSDDLRVGDTGFEKAEAFLRVWSQRFPDAPEVKAAAAAVKAAREAGPR